MEEKRFRTAMTGYVLSVDTTYEGGGKYRTEYRLKPEEICAVGRQYLYTTAGNRYFKKTGEEKTEYRRTNNIIFPSRQEAIYHANFNEICFRIGQYMNGLGNGKIRELDMEKLRQMYLWLEGKEWGDVSIHETDLI